MSSNYHFLGKTLDIWCLENIRDDSGQLKHYNQWNKSGNFVKVNWKPYMGSNKNLSKNYRVVKKISAVLCKSPGSPKQGHKIGIFLKNGFYFTDNNRILLFLET